MEGRALCSLLVLGSLGLLCGCGSNETDESEAPVAIDVTVIGADGQPPPRYRAILADASGAISAVTCPDAPEDTRLRCTPDGVLAGAAGELTIKAPGYAFQTQSTSSAAEGISLEALPAFEVDANYQTGFDAEGAEAFRAFAVSVDTELGPALSVKFLIRDIATERRVYFQNTRQNPLHYDFARNVLGMPLSLSEFEATTYQGADRRSMAGTLVWYPSLALGSELTAPVVLTFFPSDDLTPAQAQQAHRWIEERLIFAGIDGGDGRLVYVPAGAVQEAALLEAAPVFSSRESLFATRGQIYAGLTQQILNPGLAYGTLRLIPPEQLELTPLSFRDIVVLPRLPNDLPIVGGTITEELQTPLAHVNVAARARGTPNLALIGASSDARVAPLLDQLVRFEVSDGAFSLAAATLEEAQAHWDSQIHPRTVPESDLTRTDLPAFEDFAFADWTSFGVKAANLAELRQLLGDQAPPGFGVPFSAYDAYMSQNLVTLELCAAARTDCEAEGRAAALCDHAALRCVPGDTFYAMADRLIADAEVQTDTPLREACLDGLVYLIGDGTVDAAFAAALDARVQEIFGAAKVRLRSSTNAEDLVDFNGAGLYESKSAYASGPDCASLRVRKVWASVWRFKAFEERSFWNIDHRAVRMGVAVSLAYDDEVANGVLITQNIADPNTAGMYVNVQQGEVSVTNPTDGAVPEVFSIIPAPGGGVQAARTGFSSLSPTEPLLSDAEISDLYGAARRVQLRFSSLYGIHESVLALDLEFKFHGPSRALIIKQARPYSAGT